jgi:hypothetical protein
MDKPTDSVDIHTRRSARSRGPWRRSRCAIRFTPCDRLSMHRPRRRPWAGPVLRLPVHTTGARAGATGAAGIVRPARPAGMRPGVSRRVRASAATPAPRRKRAHDRGHTLEGKGILPGQRPGTTSGSGDWLTVPAACRLPGSLGSNACATLKRVLTAVLFCCTPGAAVRIFLLTCGATGLEPVTPCVQTEGSTSTGIHPHRSPSRDVPASPPRSAPVAVLSCCTHHLDLQTSRATQLRSPGTLPPHEESRAGPAASTVVAEPGACHSFTVRFCRK